MKTVNLVAERSEDEVDDGGAKQLCGCDRPPPRKKVNCLPVAILVFLSIVRQISPTDAKPLGKKCSDPSAIQYKNSTSGEIFCKICPECIPSQQHSIPCGSTVDIKKGLGRCVDCPDGTFSSGWDKKPCSPCTICTNKIYLKNCTKSQNAQCGGCKEGFTYDTHTFSCVKSPAKSTASVSSTTSQPTTDHVMPTSLLPTTLATGSKPTFTTKNSSTPTLSFINASRNYNGSTTPNSTSSHGNNLIIANCSVAFILILIGMGMALQWKHKKSRSRNNGGDVEANVLLENKNNNEQLLDDFVKKNPDEVENLCKVLYKQRRFGEWDFEKLGKKWKRHINTIDLEFLVEQGKQGVNNCNPVQAMIDKLCIEVRPSITVRCFAESLKNINWKAYRILRPHFKAKATVSIITEAV